MALRKAGLCEDKFFMNEAGEAGFRFCVGFASLQLLVRPTLTIVVSNMVDATIFGTDQQIGFAVTVKIADRRAGCVAGHVATSQISHSFQHHGSIDVFAIAIPRGVFGIDQHIVSAVPVPVDDGQFVPA